MKEILAIIVVISLVALTGCTGEDPYTPPQETYENLVKDYTLFDNVNNVLTFPDDYTVQINHMQDTSKARLVKAIQLHGDFQLEYSFMITELTPPITEHINGGWFAQVFSISGTVPYYAATDTLSGGGTLPYNQSFAAYWRCFGNGSSGGPFNIFSCYRDMRHAWSTGIRVDWGGTQLNTWYDVKLYRLGTTIFVEYYQSGTLVWTDSLGPEEGYGGVDILFEYFYPIIGRGTGFGYYYASAVFKNFKFSAPS